MQLHQLKRQTKRLRGRQVGRGGRRGKTSGRGTKGQKARAGHKMYPEIRDIIKKIPKLRGRGYHSLKSFRPADSVVNLSAIAVHFESGETVSPETLLERKLVKKIGGAMPKVKILGDGEIQNKKISFTGVSFSASAKKKIEEAGGTIS